MTLPVSSYEELLSRVRSLTHETRQLQRQIDAPLLDHNENERLMNSIASEWSFKPRTDSFSALDPSISSSQPKDVVGTRWTKEQGASPEAKEQEESHATQGTDRGGMTLIGSGPMCHSTAAVHSKQSQICDGGLSYSYSYSSEQLGTKVEMVYNLLSMLGTHDRTEMTSTLLAMSSSPDSCKAMRQSGCLSLLVQLVHSSGESCVVRQRAAQALRNMVLCHGDDKRGRREARVLRLLDQVSSYNETAAAQSDHTEETHPGPALAALMKLSFDEEHRLAMCQLGALYVVARLVQVEANHQHDCCITLKRYAGMALTNLTFGDGNNKALLASMKPFMTALVSQLSSSTEDLTQVTASVLRNLSWRADAASKQSLREVGSVPALMKAAMTATREPTLKSVLSALWNLSAHCNVNKIDICAVDGALLYLVDMLNYQSASKTLSVVENAGGILRNISSHIAVREDYRKLLREHNCLAILLRQLQSPSLTVVSNACGTLWNLSARCATDQRALVTLGAVPMLTSLSHSRHRMIAMGASAALKNLLPVRLAQQQAHTPSGSATLLVRKRRALEAELNSTLSETCDNIDAHQWEQSESHTEDETTEPAQAKDDCDQINQSMQRLTTNDETSEQPVNYSLKYNEDKSNETDNDTVNYSIKFKDEGQPAGQSDYAETDLDQLTDFSLRYSEEEQTDDSASDKKQSEQASVETSPGKIDQSVKAAVLETPLMFSRCSSLGSLSSCEQQDDCRSSVVSEFSRMTSGIMSPSDLPDSPTQTVPPSPRVKAPPSVAAETSKSVERPGFFDDAVVAFKEESTPAQFSTATSLSDLTFDDDPHDNCERKELELAAVSEEEDEHILADVINSGMQNNRERVETVANSRIPRARSIPVKTPPRPTHNSCEDAPKQFCTEDTPANLSHATSHSELSALSDASSDQENILNECIQSGMPQPQQLQSEKKGPKVSPGLNSVKISVVKPCTVIIPERLRDFAAEDEVSVFADEGNSPFLTSLSDITINSKPEGCSLGTPPPAENPSPLSSLDPDVSVDEVEAVTVLSGNSADEVTLAEQEDQALLMQVISSGMPSSAGDKMKDSTDTWAEETSSFPSISLTAPVIPSYESDDDERTEATLTSESRVIQLEHGKVALISHMELEGSYDEPSTLENELPPANMASVLSLTSSSAFPNEKKTFELSESFLGSCHDLDSIDPPSGVDSIMSLSMSRPGPKSESFLENIKPPADLDEMLDLDSSILSVASLKSEVVGCGSLEDVTLEATPPPRRRPGLAKRDVNSLRYNTYVINKTREEEDMKKEEETAVKEKTTAKQRRQADRDRFRTRTIHDVPAGIERLESLESEGSCSPTGQPSESPSETEDPPRPVITKPPEVKTIRGGGAATTPRSSIPVVRSPAKTPPSSVNLTGVKRKTPVGLPQPPLTATTPGGTPLQRQGTFTKDDSGPSTPSTGIPVLVKSKVASPLKKTNLTTTAKTGSGRGRAASLPNKGGLSSVRPSLSSQSLKTACSTGSGSDSGGRWHSNSSLNSGSGGSGSKKEINVTATSKIAGLWKKVDESKRKGTQGKDSRVWIPPEPKSKQTA